MDLVHCIYCSASTAPNVSEADLEAILEKSRQNNAKTGITGILLYRNGSFFQVLEGDRSAVETLFNTIDADTRHLRVTKIVLEPITERAFASWTMGYPKITSKELARISGLNDFFLRGESYMEIGEGRAKTLLAAFKEERWRLTLS
jgi:acylphosphatase